MKRFVSIFCVLILLIGTLFTATLTASADTEVLLLGDANGDGKVNVKDATTIQKFVAGLIDLANGGIPVADADNNGKVNIKDATAIQKFVAGMLPDSAIGKPCDSNEGTTPTEPEATEPETTVPEPTTPDKPSAITEFSPIDTNPDDDVTAEMLAAIEAGFLRLVNEERTKAGLAPLTYNKHLDEVAQMRSADLKILYSHKRPDGSSWSTLVDRNKYFCSDLGENISYESQLIDGIYNPSRDVFTGSDEQIEFIYTKIFNDFKNSPVHYENMMKPVFEHTGIGFEVRYLPNVQIPFFYVSQIFGADFNLG